MNVHVRQSGNPDGASVVLVAGFADHGGLFDRLAGTEFGARFALHAVDLPGTGRSAPLTEPLTLARAASIVANVAIETSARTIVGHSVGSIVAALAAATEEARIETMISLEGNLTAADAYFSGSAARYDNPEVFHAEFLARLDELAADDDVVRRYRNQVAAADSASIWELGCDTNRFSTEQSPGDHLSHCAGTVHYIYNPYNTPADSLAWLAANTLSATIIDASHWPTIDKPDLLAEILLGVLDS